MDDLLNKLDHDKKNKNNVSKLMKQNMWEFLNNNYYGGNIVELGTFHGNTTVMFAEICKQKGGKVYTIEHHLENINIAKNLIQKFKLENFVEFIHADLYKDNWIDKIKNVEFSFIDANHEVIYLEQDTNNCIKLDTKYICYHDYGLNLIRNQPGSGSAVKKFLKEYKEKLNIIKIIGEENGKWVTTRGTNDYEGAIVYVIKK